MLSAIEIQDWPSPRFHVFLSHVAEDRNRLIEHVHRKLIKNRITPWYDQTDYPAGMEPIDTLQESLLNCHHVVYFITACNLSQGRGWSSAERAISSRINRHFHISSHAVHHYELPLFLVPHHHTETARSIWNPLRQGGKQCPHRIGTENSIDWAVNVITRFVSEQQELRREILTKIARIHSLKSQIDLHRGMKRWLEGVAITPIR
jgi:TIR domain